MDRETSRARSISGAPGRSRPRSSCAPARPVASALRFLSRYTAPSREGRGLLLVRGRAQTNLARPGEDGVFEIDRRVLIDRRVDPVAFTVARLAEDAATHAVGAQLAVEDEDVDLKALVRRLRRAEPVGDDDAAERIGRSQRHERNGVEA